MKTKIFTSLVVAGFFTGLSSQALASSGFENTVNSQLGNGASVSCNACHAGATSTATATLPMALAYKAARTANDYTLIATLDSDNDGYINKNEVNGAGIEFNDAATSPFTKAAAANGDANVKSLADTAAISATFSDPKALAGAGKEILGGIKVTLNQADTLYFKAGGVGTTDTVYSVDAAGAGTALATADWMSGADGSLQVTALPAGAAFPVDIIVVRSVPVAAAATVAQDTASIYGCTTASLSTPLLMFLAMFTLGFLVRKKV